MKMMTKTHILLSQAVTESVGRAMRQHRIDDAVRRVLQADDEEENERNKLKVLNDGDGVKLLMSVYTDYVSDDDFVKFPKFMYDVDTLLFKARGNRTLTREEREEMEEAAPKRGKRGKKKPKPAAPSGNFMDDDTATPPNNDNSGQQQVTAMDTGNDLGNFFARHLTRVRR